VQVMQVLQQEGRVQAQGLFLFQISQTNNFHHF
jgi:hypothetical protein